MKKIMISIFMGGLFSMVLFNFGCVSKENRNIYGELVSTQRLPASVKGIYSAFDQSLWDHLQSHQDGSAEYLIKFFVFLDSGGAPKEIFYQDETYEFHHQALQNFPDYRGMTRKEIEKISFFKKDRRLLLGVLSFPVQGDNDNHKDVSFYLMSEDVPAARDIKKVQQLIVNSITAPEATEHINNQVASKANFAPLPDQRNAAVAIEKELREMGVYLDLSKNQKSIQAYNDGWAAGPLVVVENQKDLDDKLRAGVVNEKTILLAKSEIRELPPVAGVISGIPLINASHLVLLAQMYGMPLVFDVDAVASLSAMAGKSIYLATALEKPTEYELAVNISANSLSRLEEQKRQKKLNVTIDLTATAIRSTRDLSFQNIPAYGGKASQFGVLQRTIESNTRAYGAGIPVSVSRNFYLKAKSPDGKGNLWNWIQAHLAAIPANANYLDVDAQLEAIRDGIKKTEVPSDLVESIRKDLVSLLKAKPDGSQNEIRVKLRSSGNVEDGAEFNGAGLYDSKGACLLQCDKADKKDQLGAALNKVWRSIYSTRGYWARRKFQVPEKDVAMGVLVHFTYKNEEANGVIRTKRMKSFDDTYYASSEIVAAPGGDEESVDGNQGGLITGGGNGAKPEIVEISSERFSQRQPYQNRPSGSYLMANENYVKLHQLMTEVFKAYPNEAGLEIEAEWKLMPASQFKNVVQIKQVRRVPKNPLVLKNQEKFILVFDQKVKLKSSPELSLVNGPWVFYRPSEIVVDGVDAIYESELSRAGQIRLPKISYTIQGKEWVAENVVAKLIKEPSPDGATVYKLRTTALPGLPKGTSLVLSHFYNKASEIITASGAYVDWQLEYDSNALPGIKNALFSDRMVTRYFNSTGEAGVVRMNAEKNLDRVLSLRRIGQANKGVWGSYQPKLLACGYDDCAYAMPNLQLNGLLASGRAINLAESAYARHEITKHEGLTYVWVDFSLIEGISPEDRKEILTKWGRFMFRSNYGNQDSGPLSETDMAERQEPFAYFFVNDRGEVRGLDGKIYPRPTSPVDDE